MSKLLCFVPFVVNERLRDAEREYLSEIFDRCNGYPNLQQLWQLVDEQWQAHGCNHLQMDWRVSAFYRHPVWLLNGLFTEQDPQSLAQRRAFTAWVTDHAPLRVADFGGGFGGLARLIGAALPQASVEVVEPYPHEAAIALAEETPNVRFVPELKGVYDLLIATDVFEHVPDPVALAASTANHLRIGGSYLIANCFAPVITCHLPQLFHLSIGWDEVMRGMGLQPLDKLLHGRVYLRTGNLDELKARRSEALAARIYKWLKFLPKGRSNAGQILMRLATYV